jgi:TetR/AcrR family transcriptional regulator, transcriptional repressor for nem operon
MKVSRSQVEKHRKQILDRAIELFRERGFDGVGLADIMKSAGLTHGGFYGHFASKNELIAQAYVNGLATSEQSWLSDAAKNPANPLAAMIKSYLSSRHRDDLAGGCVFAALGAETVRQSERVRRVFTDGLGDKILFLMKYVPGLSERARHRRAIATLAGLIGALILARTVDDQALSDEILRAVADSLSPSASGVNQPPKSAGKT